MNEALGLKTPRDGVSSTLPNYDNNLALAALVPASRRSLQYSYSELDRKRPDLDA